MKTKLKILFKKPILIILFFILLVYFPVGLASSSEGIERLYPITISIDKLENNEYQVGLLSFLTTQNTQYSENYFLLRGNGKSLSDAIISISNILGRRITLTHTTTILLGKSILNENIATTLDYFYRNELVNNDTYLIFTNLSAFDILTIEKTFINLSSISLEDVARFNSQNTLFSDTNIESFYKGYFSPNKTSFISLLKTPEEYQQQTSETSSKTTSNGQGNKEESSDFKTDDLLNKFEVCTFYDGKFSNILTQDDITSWNITNPKTKNTTFTLENFSNEIFDNATLTFLIRQNKVKISTRFENNKPILEYNICLYLTLNEVDKTTIIEKDYSSETNFLTEELQIRIENELKTKFSSFLKKLTASKTDILNVYSLFSQKNYFEFNDWIETLENPENFLEKIEYRMSINSQLSK